jgi:hypothetical protein
MKRRCWKLLSALALVCGAASAEETRIMVRVRSVDAKFVGSGVGGLRVTIEDAESGEVLDEGHITGGSGDTRRLMETPAGRGQPLADARTAGYLARLDLKEPRLLRFQVMGPYAHRQALQHASVTTWVVPGKHIEGDGLVIGLPGFIVRARAEPPRKGGSAARLEAEVSMMCGCPITRGGLWNAEQYEVRALVSRNGEPVGEPALSFTGTTGLYAGELPVRDKGDYDVTIYAYDPKTGNTGVDRTVFSVP